MDSGREADDRSTEPVDEPTRRWHPPSGEDLEVEGFPPLLDNGRYRREFKLGRGGMGVVYGYRDPKLDRLVAVKTIPRAWATPRWRQRFLREAKMLASLDHANIGRIHHIAEHDGADYLILEYVPGRTLQRVTQTGPLATPRALTIARQVAEAIRAGHAIGVIHRDVKPGNIMVRPDDVAKLLDYGLARTADDADDEIEPSDATLDDDPDRTRLGAVVGTPGYMSPEQASGDRVDHRTDIWAFGCVLYECLTGSPAFPGRSKQERIDATLGDDPDWALLPDDAPAIVCDILRRCLIKDQRRRLADLQQVGEQLEEPHRGRLAPAGARPTRPTNLPAPLTSFVPRHGELDRLGGLLEQSRLLTLTGAGGCGKTRLAIALAHVLRERPPTFVDGIWLVELASLGAAELIPQAIASALGERSPERRRGSPLDSLIETIGDGRMLLVLDDCEHLAEGCGNLVRTLLTACPGVTVLVTSRKDLGIEGEQIYTVPSLSYPPLDGTDTPGRRYESVELFRARARLARPEIELPDDGGPADPVEEICRRLEGLPLAIELAAARMRSLSIEQIASRLPEVVGAAPVMETSIRSSVDLLSDAERHLLGRLAVFRGGWTLEAAETICGDGDDSTIDDAPVLELLSQLVHRSLVRYEVRADRTRYHLLEVVREHCTRHLAEHDRMPPLRDRHLSFYTGVAREADDGVSGPDQAACLGRLETEHDNLRSALGHAATDDSAQKLGELAKAMSELWRVHGHLEEGRTWLERAIVRRGATDDVLQIRLCNAAGTIAGRLADVEGGRRHYDAALSIARRLGDRRREAGILTNLGTLLQESRDIDGCRRCHCESMRVYDELGDKNGVAMVQLNLGDVLLQERQDDDARQLFDDCLPVFEAIGDQQRIAATSHNIGQLALRRGDLDAAEASLQRALAIRRDLGDRRGASSSLLWLGVLESERGAHRRAATLFGAADMLRQGLAGDSPAATDSDYARAVASAMQGLGEAKFSAARRDGMQLDLASAVTLGLGGGKPIDG